LQVVDGRVVPAGAEPLPEPVRRAVHAVTADLAGTPFRAPPAERLDELGLSSAALAAAHRAGALLRVADRVVLAAGSDRAAVTILAGLPQPFTISEAGRALDSSRRVVLPLLQWLDRTGRTRRLADDRRCVVSPHSPADGGGTAYVATRGGTR
jgi:selenocysteine-specific elongation factor